MKLLLVLGSDDHYDTISRNIASAGFEMIRYRHVLKAMDNIDEIDPAAIIISARDFPRHWKILVQFVRNERTKEVCPIIIMRGRNFSAEETSKAFFIGINGIITETLEKQEDIDRLRKILGSSIPADENRKHQLVVEPWHRIGLLIADLSGKSFIIGDVKTISSDGLSFDPIHPPVNPVKLHKELSECSLRIGEMILSPVCRITDMGKVISLEFVSFPDGEQRILDRYLEEFFVQEPLLEKVC